MPATEHTARVQASQLLTKLNVRAAINDALRKRQMSPEQVIAEVEAIAQSSIKELWNESGNVMMCGGQGVQMGLGVAPETRGAT